MKEPDKMNRIGLHLMLVLLGLSYVFSGAVKLVPAEFFENDILRSGLGNDFTAPFQARILIGLEFLIGLFLIFAVRTAWTLRLSCWMLAVYTIYLIYMLIRFGNDESCGCFGPDITLTPVQGILKNLVLLGFSYFLLRITPPETDSRWRRIAVYPMLLISFIAPFVIYKIDLPEKMEINGETKIKLELDLLYQDTTLLPSFEVRQGKAIVAFASMACPKCRIAANRLELIKKQHPELPVYLVVNGKMEMLDEFLKVTEVDEMPYFVFNDGESLVKICGASLPAIFLIRDGYLEHPVHYLELSSDNLLEWYRKEED